MAVTNIAVVLAVETDELVLDDLFWAFANKKLSGFSVSRVVDLFWEYGCSITVEPKGA